MEAGKRDMAHRRMVEAVVWAGAGGAGGGGVSERGRYAVRVSRCMILVGAWHWWMSVHWSVPVYEKEHPEQVSVVGT